MAGIFAARRQRTRGIVSVVALYTAALWDVVQTAGAHTPTSCGRTCAMPSER